MFQEVTSFPKLLHYIGMCSCSFFQINRILVTSCSCSLSDYFLYPIESFCCFICPYGNQTWVSHKEGRKHLGLLSIPHTPDGDQAGSTALPDWRHHKVAEVQIHCGGFSVGPNSLLPCEDLLRTL